MSRLLSARSRLTLLYTALFTLGGTALVLITYLLVAHTLHPTATPRIPASVQRALEQCLQAARTGRAGVMQKCAAVYANGVQAGAAAQRSTTLTHLLTYSLLSLAGATLIAAAAGWIAAGRILAPVHRLTAAARASLCRARATSCASSPTPSTPCSNGSTGRSPASGSSSPTQAMSFARR